MKPRLNIKYEKSETGDKTWSNPDYFSRGCLVEMKYNESFSGNKTHDNVCSRMYSNAR